MFENATAFDQDISAWDVTWVSTMADMFKGVTLSTANYDAILIGWESQNVRDDVEFHGGNSRYSPGPAADARARLINDHALLTEAGREITGISYIPA